MVENLSLGQLTKEMIVSRLKDSQDAPALAADMVKQTIFASMPSIKASGRDPKESVEDICFGAMSGLLLIEKDLPNGAMLILTGMAEIAQKVNIDPSELMTWTMEGIARIAPLVASHTLEDTRMRIEKEYMGAGEVFGSLCNKYKDQKQ